MVNEAKPRPIQHSQSEIFKAPIGARTEINMSFSLAIFTGLEHHKRIVGFIFQNQHYLEKRVYLLCYYYK